MSIQALAWVLENSSATHAERLVLMSLANHAHADGTNAYPSVAVIAQEALLSERRVQTALKTLVEEGHIAQDGWAHDERIPQNRRPRNYIICGVKTGSPQGVQGRRNGDSGVQKYAFRGEDGFTQTKTKPTTNLESTRATKASAIPERWVIDQEMREWAERETPTVNISRESHKFVDHYKSVAGARALKRDWRRTWQNWMRRAEDGF